MSEIPDLPPLSDIPGIPLPDPPPMLPDSFQNTSYCINLDKDLYVCADIGLLSGVTHYQSFLDINNMLSKPSFNTLLKKQESLNSNIECFGLIEVPGHPMIGPSSLRVCAPTKEDAHQGIFNFGERLIQSLPFH